MVCLQQLAAMVQQVPKLPLRGWTCAAALAAADVHLRSGGVPCHWAWCTQRPDVS